MPTIAEHVLGFNQSLTLGNIQLPEDIRAMNPFQGEHKDLINRVTSEFFNKFYADSNPRRLILGINPGRLGAGLTGVAFTDTKRLLSDCDIEVTEFKSHEPSSVFVYEVIRAYGGAKKFYADFYITSMSPLGYVIRKPNGKEINYNYYDRPDLEKAVTPFILDTLKRQFEFGLLRDRVFCMGTGKNYKFVKKLNAEHQLFGEVVPLEHPRYVVQYRNKRMPEYVDKYLNAFAQ